MELLCNIIFLWIYEKKLTHFIFVKNIFLILKFLFKPYKVLKLFFVIKFIDFNGMSTHLGLFYVLRVRNHIHTYMFCVVVS